MCGINVVGGGGGGGERKSLAQCQGTQTSALARRKIEKYSMCPFVIVIDSILPARTID